MIHLTDFIKFQMAKSSYVGMVLPDLYKEFNTVDHIILLMKLEAIGLNKVVLISGGLSATCRRLSYALVKC